MLRITQEVPGIVRNKDIKSQNHLVSMRELDSLEGLKGIF